MRKSKEDCEIDWENGCPVGEKIVPQRFFSLMLCQFETKLYTHVSLLKGAVHKKKKHFKILSFSIIGYKTKGKARFALPFDRWVFRRHLLRAHQWYRWSWWPAARSLSVSRPGSRSRCSVAGSKKRGMKNQVKRNIIKEKDYKRPNEKKILNLLINIHSLVLFKLPYILQCTTDSFMCFDGLQFTGAFLLNDTQ